MLYPLDCRSRLVSQQILIPGEFNENIDNSAIEYSIGIRSLKNNRLTKRRKQKQYQKDKTLYLVKWLGYSNQENTWEPYSHLKKAPEKVREWKSRRDRQKKRLQQKNKAKKIEQNPLNSAIDTSKRKTIAKADNFLRIDSRTILNNNKIGQKKSRPKLSSSYKVYEQADQQFQTQQTINKLKTSVFSCNQESNLGKKPIHTSQQMEKSIFSSQPKFKEAKNNSKAKDKKNMLQISRKEELQGKEHSGQNKKQTENQQMIIQISDSKSSRKDQLVSCISQQQEIILQQEVSYSSECFPRIQPPQFFLGMQMPKNPVQKPLLQRQQFLKRSTNQNLKKKKKAQNQFQLNQFQCQLDYNIQELLPQSQFIQKLLYQINPHEQALDIQRDIIDYDFLDQIVQIYKEDGVLYCRLNDKNGLTVEKVTYQSIQALRSDLVKSFFQGKYPSK